MRDYGTELGRRVKREPMQLTFEDFHELVVGKIAVAKVDVPPYMMGGTLYIRHGSSDVQARPDEVVRLVSQL
jgi:predicted HTH transcriptional regulator